MGKTSGRDLLRLHAPVVLCNKWLLVAYAVVTCLLYTAYRIAQPPGWVHAPSLHTTMHTQTWSDFLSLRSEHAFAEHACAESTCRELALQKDNSLWRRSQGGAGIIVLSLLYLVTYLVTS